MFAPPIKYSVILWSGLISLRVRSNSSSFFTQSIPSKSLLVIIMLVLFGRGFESGKDSNVFLPIITIFPVVNSLNLCISSGIEKSISPSFPIAKFLSTANITFINKNLPSLYYLQFRSIFPLRDCLSNQNHLHISLRQVYPFPHSKYQA